MTKYITTSHSMMVDRIYALSDADYKIIVDNNLDYWFQKDDSVTFMDKDERPIQFKSALTDESRYYIDDGGTVNLNEIDNT